MKTKEKRIKILAIETSCDETSAAVITAAPYEITNLTKVRNYESRNTDLTPETYNLIPEVLSNIIASQVDLHKLTGGVVPEVASRAHVESIIPVIKEALLGANNQDTPLRSTSSEGQARNNNQTNSKFKIRNPKQILNSNVQNSKPVSDFGFRISDLLQDITHIAVTNGPGLVGALLVGVNTAKTLAYALGVPIIPVNHIEGHIYSALEEPTNEYTNLTKLQMGKQIPNSKSQSSTNSHLAGVSAHLRGEEKPEIHNLIPEIFPVLALTVSGGHTSLTLMTDHGKYQTIGQTRDDAAGEAFDKVAKLLDLGYPGGPAVSKLAEEFRNRITKIQDTITKQIPNSKSKKSTASHLAGVNAHLRGETNSKSQNLKPDSQNLTANSSFMFPRPMIDDESFDFSFSGLKTAVLYEVRKRTHPLTNLQIKRKYKSTNTTNKRLTASDKQEICYEFEEAVVDVLLAKTKRAAAKYNPKTIIVAGGVSANQRLWKKFTEELSINNQDTRYKIQTNSKFEIRNSKQTINSKSKNNKNYKSSTYNLTPDTCQLFMPPAEMCGDNAAMIGLAAYYHILRGDLSTWDKIEVDSNLHL